VPLGGPKTTCGRRFCPKPAPAPGVNDTTRVMKRLGSYAGASAVASTRGAASSVAPSGSGKESDSSVEASAWGSGGGSGSGAADPRSSSSSLVASLVVSVAVAVTALLQPIRANSARRCDEETAAVRTFAPNEGWGRGLRRSADDGGAVGIEGGPNVPAGTAYHDALHGRKRNCLRTTRNAGRGGRARPFHCSSFVHLRSVLPRFRASVWTLPRVIVESSTHRHCEKRRDRRL
jgi:hypothetical protein